MAARDTADLREMRVSAPGKVILHGEHSVVYGKTALACSLDIRTTTKIRSAFNKRQIQVEFPDLGRNHIIPIVLIKPVLEQLRTLGSENSPELVSTIVSLLQDAFPESAEDSGLLVFLYLFTCISSNLSVGQLLPVEVTVHSDIPIGAGLGSSAAFSVSLAGAIYHYLKKCSKSSHNGTSLSNERLNNGSQPLTNSGSVADSETDDIICKWAYNAEKIIHGNPSGLDNSICTYGGLLSYRKYSSTLIGGDDKSCESNLTSKNVMESISVPRNLRILLVNTKIARSTKALVAKVGQERLNLLPKVTSHILEAMDRVSQECKDTFAAIVNNSNVLNNNSNGVTMNNGVTVNNGFAINVEDQEKHRALFHKLEQLIDVNQGLLSALGVSHPTLDQIQSICLSKGQLHSKLTGAGGGGFAFALVTPFHSEAQVSAVKTELQKEGFDCWDTNIAGEGLKIHYN